MVCWKFREDLTWFCWDRFRAKKIRLAWRREGGKKGSLTTWEWFNQKYCFEENFCSKSQVEYFFSEKTRSLAHTHVQQPFSLLQNYLGLYLFLPDDQPQVLACLTGFGVAVPPLPALHLPFRPVTPGIWAHILRNKILTFRFFSIVI